MVGLRFVPADLGGHVEALADLDPLDLDGAVGLALRTRAIFPTPVEVRSDADVVRAKRIAAAAPVAEDRFGDELATPALVGHLPAGTPVYASREWRDYCDRCGDTGMASFWCGARGADRYPWMPVSTCHGDTCRKTKYAHEWVQRCACWDSNPALIRKREAARKYAADAVSKQGR